MKKITFVVSIFMIVAMLAACAPAAPAATEAPAAPGSALKPRLPLRRPKLLPHLPSQLWSTRRLLPILVIWHRGSA